MQEASLPGSDHGPDAHDSVVLLLSSILPLTKTVCLEVVTTLFGGSVSVPNSMPLDGAPLSADKDLFTTSVDLEQALHQALAVLKGGQKVRGSHSMGALLALHAGGKVCILLMHLPMRLLKAIFGHSSGSVCCTEIRSTTGLQVFHLGVHGIVQS